MTTFAELGLSEPLCRTLDDDAAPSALQQRVIPPLLERRDLLAVAADDAARTAALVLALLQRLCDPAVRAEKKEPRAVVLVEDGERADAIGVEFEARGRFVPVRHLVVAGGSGWSRAVRELRTGIEVLVATPQRLRELLRQQAVALRGVEIAVVDALDQLLEAGAAEELDRLVDGLPPGRQLVLFAAAATRELADAARAWLRDPAWIADDAAAKAKRGRRPAAGPRQPSPASRAAPPPVELPEWFDQPDPVRLPSWLDERPARRAGPAAAASDPAPTRGGRKKRKRGKRKKKKGQQRAGSAGAGPARPARSG